MRIVRSVLSRAPIDLKNVSRANMPRQGEMYLPSRRPLHSESSSALPEAVSHTPARSACSNLSANRSAAVVIAPPARRCAHINVAQQDAPQSDQQPLSRLTPQIKGHILKMKSADGPCCPLCGPRFAEIEDQRAHLWITFPQAPRRRAGLAQPLGSGAPAPHHLYCSGGHQPAGPHVDSRMSRVTIPNDPTWRILSGGSIRDALSV